MVGPLYVAVRGGWEKQFGSSGSVLASQGPRPVETASLPGSVPVSQVLLRNVELGRRTSRWLRRASPKGTTSNRAAVDDAKQALEAAEKELV